MKQGKDVRDTIFKHETLSPSFLIIDPKCFCSKVEDILPLSMSKEQKNSKVEEESIQEMVFLSLNPAKANHLE